MATHARGTARAPPSGGAGGNWRSRPPAGARLATGAPRGICRRLRSSRLRHAAVVMRLPCSRQRAASTLSIPCRLLIRLPRVVIFRLLNPRVLNLRAILRILVNHPYDSDYSSSALSCYRSSYSLWPYHDSPSSHASARISMFCVHSIRIRRVIRINIRLSFLMVMFSES